MTDFKEREEQNIEYEQAKKWLNSNGTFIAKTKPIDGLTTLTFQKTGESNIEKVIGGDIVPLTISLYRTFK
jgi:hypothetical protein